MKIGTKPSKMFSLDITAEKAARTLISLYKLLT